MNRDGPEQGQVAKTFVYRSCSVQETAQAAKSEPGGHQSMMQAARRMGPILLR